MIRIEPYQDWRGVWAYRLMLADRKIQEGYITHAAAEIRVRLIVASRCA